MSDSGFPQEIIEVLITSAAMRSDGKPTALFTLPPGAVILSRRVKRVGIDGAVVEFLVEYRPAPTDAEGGR